MNVMEKDKREHSEFDLVRSLPERDLRKGDQVREGVVGEST